MEFNQQLLVDSLKAEYKHQDLPFSLHIFNTVSSTNQTLWQLIDQTEKTNSVVIATQQTAGRGQWGRQWLSSTGGLYLSMSIVPQLAATNSYQLTLATAWGITAQFQKCGIPVGIKWPNDLVLDGRKLGGILTETKVNKGQITQAVIGVGINWANSVPETGINLQIWQNSQNYHMINHLEMLTSQVLIGIKSGIECLQTEGINILLSRYLDVLTNMGDQVYVNNFLGTVVGVTQEGNLRLKMTNDDLKAAVTPEISCQPGTISLGYRQSSVL
ncbi:biotin--[acetyl-CoA-carboxylase] ligase [Anabaena sp. UHCC 0253]|uniref:biotin--[acetyl-CoA-carboxylase] ligase n=1 Tax=unclassified Anabaena TaxID=2619674 RepID=UPI0014465576|nr:biotin--[acetyl-CoA-carboxylase] ligase [Anabaena sp. UHCC 0204]MTJ52300.1 biotin--[acetyl-CoA-carboxylase] ligase [Anabaena sp. UHCC 0253]